MKNYIVATAISACVIILTCCGGMPEGNCFEYRSAPFILSGELECDGCDYILDLFYLSDEKLTVQVCEPQRIAGCKIALGTDGGAVLSFGTIEVNISGGENSENYGVLAALRELVLPPEDSLVSADVVKVGDETFNLAIFKTPRGRVSVWFDRNGNPVRFEAGGMILSVTSFERDSNLSLDTES